MRTRCLSFLPLILLLLTGFASFGQATLFTVPTNGHYCSGTTGVQIRMAHSQNGITYHLRRLPAPGDLATATGNGDTITFAGSYTTGTYYTVINTTQVTVVMDPQPALYVFSATNNGAYCNYPGAPGVELKVQPTQAGVNYELFRGTTSIDMITGTGSPISFGYYANPGSYHVVASYPLTGCSRTSSAINIVANTPPTANFISDHDSPPLHCASDVVNFTSTSAGTGLSYSWNFHDVNSGTNNTANGSPTSHIFEAYGNGNQTFGVLLTVTDSHGCIDTITKSVTVMQKPDATLNETLNLPNPNYPNTFAVCDANSTSPVGAFSFVNGSSTISSNTWYNINWGNSLIPTYNQSTFNSPLPVTYNTYGYDTITYTVNGNNGCANTRYYRVYVGNFAGGGIENPGGLAGIAPFCKNFKIQDSSYFNPPNTKFTFDWGDGTDTVILRQDLPLSKIITHCYTSCSSVLTGTPPKYAFRATCYTENPCGSAETTVFPLVVSCRAQGNFGTAGGSSGFGGSEGSSWGANGADTLVGCNDVTFTDSTQAGFYIVPPGYNTYLTNTFYSWDFGDPASGVNNVSSLPNPVHHFTTSGMWYTVTLVVFTGQSANFNSGRDTVVKQIYIQSPPTADFTVNAPDTCVPMQVQFTDMSDGGGWGIPEFRWRVTPPTGWSIITPNHAGDSTYNSPLFLFTAAGRYTVKFLIANSCGIDEKDTTILACEPPEVAFTDGTDLFLCGPQKHNFGPSYDLNCDSTLVDYKWIITPGTVTFMDGTTDTSAYPHINFNAYSDYLVKAIIQNSCGSDTASQNIHVTQMITNNTISPYTPLSGEICAGQAPIVINGALPSGGNGSYTYQWQENVNCDLTPSGTWSNIIVGGTLQNYTLMSPLSATRCYRRLAFDASDCSDTSNIAQIIVYPAILNNQIATDQQICTGSAPASLTGTTAFGGSGTLSYQWESSLDGINFSVIPGATSQNYQPASLTQSTYFERVAISTPCDSNYSTPVLITVCALPGNNTISSSDTICQGTAPAQLTGTAPTGACSNYAYQWQSASEATYPTFSNIPGAISANYQPPILLSKTYYRRIITSTVSNCAQSTSNEIIIDLMLRPVPNAGLDQTISNGATANLTGAVAGGTPPYTSYQWSPPALIQPPSNTLSATTINLSGSTTFTLTVIDSNGCTGTDNMTVNVSGSPLAANASANPATVCPGSPVLVCAVASGGSGSYSYSWSSVPAGVYPATSCINVTPLVTTTYSCLVWDGFGSVTASATVTVNPAPVITSFNTESICNGEQLNYAPTSTIPNSTYTWTSSSAGTCSGNTSSVTPGTNIPDFLFNSGNTDCMLTYRITPRGPAPTFCVGLPDTLEVTVKPVASITNTVNSQTTVSGFPTAPVTFTTDVTNADIHWKYNGTNCPGFVAFSETEGFSSTLPSQIITLAPGAPSTCTLNYQVQPYIVITVGDTCKGNPFTYSFHVNSEPAKYDMICPLPICSGQTATISLSNSDAGINYTLYRGATALLPVKAGTGSQLDWNGLSTAGTYTIKATNPSNGQSTTMNGICQLTINALPQIFLLTAQNGEHCSPITLLLSGSQLGIDYNLIKDGDLLNPVQVKPGTGSAGFLVFDPVTDSGTYTVIATNPLTLCQRPMQGSVHVDPVINQFEIYPGGILCEGDVLCIDGSEPGINYQLWLNNQPFGAVVPGDPNGAPICFGTMTNAGTYRIHAKNPTTNCEIFFDSTAVIHPLPNIYVTSPVFGCAGSNILLNNCQPGIKYYLYFTPNKGAVVKEAYIAGPLTCISGIIDFGPWYDPGVYRIKAVDTVTNCSTWMSGTATIYPEPEAYNMVPKGPSCPPVDIRLDHYQLNTIYYLYRNGDTLVTTDDGTDGIVDFGAQTIPGTYKVRAQMTFAGGFECWSQMNDSTVIYRAPVKYSLLPVGPVCPPVTLFLNGSDAGVTYTLWHNTYGIRQVITSASGGNLYFLPENQPGNYWVMAKTADSCASAMYDTVQVHPNPMVYHVLPQGSGLCEPTQIGLDNSEINTFYELLHADGTSLVPPEVHTSAIAGPFWFPTPQPAGSYLVRATNLFGCDTLMNGTAVIHALPVVDAGIAADTICFPPSPSVVLSGTATNYSSVHWSSPTNPSGSNFSAPNSLVTTYVFTAADFLNKKAVLTLSAFGTGICVGSQASDSIIIHLLAPVVDAGTDQIICRNEIVQLNGTVTGGATSGVWSTSGTGTFSDSTSLISTYTPGINDQLAGTVILTLTTTNSSTCPNISDAMNVTIYGQLTPGNVTANQTICNSEIPVAVVSTAPGGGSGSFTYQWQLSTDGGATWSNVASGGNSLTYSPPALTVTTLFRLQQTDTYCTPDQVVYTNSVTITVHAVLVPGTATADQTICNGETPASLTAIAPTGGSGTFAYQWQQSTDGGITWSNVASGGNALSYSPTALTVTALFKLQQMDTYCSPDQSVYTNNVTITVNANLVPGTASTNQTICNGETPASITANAPTGGSGTYTYQWQQSTDGGTTWTNVASGGNSLSYSPPALTVTTEFRLQQTDTYCNPNQTVVTNSVTITVHSVMVPGIAATDQTICNGETPASLTAIAPTGGSGTFAYQWQQSTDGGTTWTNVSTGGNSLSYSPPALLVTTLFRLQQTDTYCNPDQSVVTNTVTITVHAVLVPGTATANQTICNGETPASISATAPTGGSGTFAYQWQQSTDGGITWSNVASGGNALSYSPTSLTVTTLFKLQQTDTYCSPDQSVYTNNVSITVNAVLIPGTASTNQTICNGETPASIAANAPTGGSGTFTYQWQLSTDGGTTWTNVVSGGNSLSYSPPALTVTTEFRLQQTDTYCNPNQTVVTNSVTITVHSVMVPGIAATDQTICNGETPASLTAIAPTGGSGTFTYQWQQSTDGGTTWTNVSTGGNSLSYSPPALLVTTLFRLQQTDTYCNPDQSVVTNTVTITVHAVLVPGTATANQTICNGETPAAISAMAPTGGSGTFAYQWQLSTDGGTTWSNVATGGNSLSYSPPALTATTVFKLQQTDTYCNPDQLVYTNNVTITVNAVLVPGTASANQTICNGEIPAAITAIAPTGGSGTIAYQWQQSTDGGATWTNVASGGNSLSYSPPALTVTTEFRLQQTDSYCNPDQLVVTNSVTITVYAVLVPGVATADQTICNGEIPSAITAIAPTGGSGTFTYQWLQSTDGGTTWTNVSTGGNSLSYSPPALLVTTLFRLQQTDTYCNPDQSVVTNTVTITVHAVLVPGTATASQTICNGETPASISATAPTGGSGTFVYQWQQSTDGGVTWSNVATGGNSLSYSPPALTITTLFRLIQTDTYCNPDLLVLTNAVTVTVYHLTPGIASSDQTICYGETPVMFTATAPTGGSGNFTYQWQFSTTSGASWTNVPVGGTSLTYSPGPLTVNTLFRLEQTDTYCTPDQVVYTNNVNVDVYNPLVAGAASADQTLCYGETPLLLAANAPTGGSGIYSYQWQYSTTGGASWSNVATGGNSLTYSPGALLVTTLFRLMQTDTYCNPDQVQYTNIITITVLTQLVAGVAGSDQIICNGETPLMLTSTPLSGGSGTYLYQWQYSTDAGLTWSNVIVGGTGLTYSPGPLTVTTLYRLMQTDTYCNPDQSIYTNNVTINVHNLLIPGAAASSQTICYGEIPAMLSANAPTGGSGSYQYQWQYSTTAGASWSDVAIGGTALTYSPAALNVTTLYRLMQTDTYCTPDQTVYTNIITISVYEELVAGTASGDQTICYGETPVMLSANSPTGGSGTFTYQWQFSTTGGATWSNVSINGNALTYTPAALFTTTLFRLMQSDTYCNPDQVLFTNTVTITVYNQLTAGIAGSDQTLCNGEIPVTLTSTALTGGSGTYLYQWQYSIDAGVTWSNVSIGGNTLSYSPGPLTQTTLYRVMQSDTYCTPDQFVYTNNVVISVHGLLVPGLAAADQVICYGETAAMLSANAPTGGSGTYLYQWQYSTTGGASWNNVAVGGTTLSYFPGVLTGTTLFRLMQMDNNCNPGQTVYTNIITITVHNQMVAGMASSDQTICNGETPVLLFANAPVGGSGTFSYQWQYSTTGGASWTNVSAGGNTLTYSPGPLFVSTMFRLMQTDGYCNPDQVLYTNAVTITVYNQLVPGNASANQTICNGAIPVMLSATAPVGGSGNFTYQWQLSVDGGLSWSNVVTGGNTLNYSPSALTVSTIFRLQQTDTYCSPDQTVTTNNVSITVQGTLIPGVASADQTICSGETPLLLSATAPAGGSGLFTYQWQTSTDGGTTWSNVLIGGNALLYSPSSLTVTTLFRLLQTDTYCTPVQTVYTNVVTITVHSMMIPGIAASNQTICYGETPAAIIANSPTGGSGTFSYQWQLSTDAGGSWTNVPSAGNSLTYSPPALTVTTWYRLQETDTYCTPDQTVTTNTVIITVYPLLVAGTATASQTICNGEIPSVISATAPSGGSGNFSYQWQFSVDGGIIWSNIITGGNSLSYLSPTLTITTMFRLNQTDTYCTPDQAVTTNIVTITVYNNLVPGIASANQTICYGETPASISSTTPSGGSGSYAYQWQQSTDGGVSWLNIASAANGLTYSPSALTVTTQYRLQQTDTYCNPGQVVITNPVTITVYSILQAGLASVDQTICYGETPSGISVSVPSGGSGSFVYQWQYSTDAGASWSNVPAGGNSLTYSPPALFTTTAYRVIQTDSYCTPDQVVISNNVIITVYSQLVAGIAGSSQTICYGEAPAMLTSTPLTGGSGSYSYQWQYSINGGLTFSNVLSGGNTLTYSPGNLTTSTIFRLMQSDTYCNPDQVVYTNAISITVYNLLVPGTASSDQAICYAEIPATIVATAPSEGSGTFVYQWEFSTNSGTTWTSVPLNGNALTYSPSALIVNTLFRLKVTDTYCNPDQSVYTNNVSITVYNQLFPGVASADQTICFGESPAMLTATLPSGGSGTFSYQWEKSVDGGINWNTIAGANSLNCAPGPLLVTTEFRILQADTYCSPDQVVISNAVTVIVYGELIAGVVSASQSVCYGAVPASLSVTMPTGGSSSIQNQWQSRVGTGSWTNISGATGTTYSPGPLYITTDFRVIQTDTYCTPVQFVTTNEISIEVRIPTAYAGPDDTICGLMPYSLAYATANYAVSYTWSTSGTGTFTSLYTLNPDYLPSPADMNAGNVILTLTIKDICNNVVVDQMNLSLGQQPAAYFAYSTPTCSSTPVYFTDQSSAGNGYIKTWVWNFGDGTSDTIHFPNSPNMYHTFSGPGPAYMVKLTVFTSLGCSSEFQQVVTTYQAPVANFSYSNIACDNQPVQFNNTSQLNGAISLQPWSWNFGDPASGINNISNLLNPTHLFSDTGTFTVTLVVINSNNCTSTISKEIRINALPAVEYTYDVSCLGDPVHFDPDTSIMQVDSIGSWSWDFGDGVTSQIQHTVHVYDAPGSYTVTLTVTDLKGCPNLVSHTILINPLPVAHFDAGTANCSGNSVQFNELTSTSTGYIIRWIWNYGDGSPQDTILFPDDPNPTHVYQNTGIYNVTLTVKASDSCSNSETIPVHIYPGPQANFTVGNACENTAVVFTDISQSNGSGNIVQWTWNFGDPNSGVNNSSPLQNPSHTFSGTGYYIVHLTTMTSNGCEGEKTTQVYVKPKPPVDFTVLSTCQNTAAIFHPNTLVMDTLTIATWSWNFGDGGSSFLQSPTHTYTNQGVFTVTLTVQDTAGCFNTISKTVTIIPQPVSNFNYSQPACNESSVQFTSLATVSSGYIVSWTWFFGDGTSVVVTNTGNPNVSHTYANFGTFNATLTVLTNNGCSQSFTKPVVISASPLGNFTFSASCLNLPVQFTDISQAGSGAMSEWLWNFGDPTTGTANQSTLQNPTHTFSNAGTSFTVKLKVTNSNGCYDTVQQLVTLSPLPVVDFDYTQGCQNDTTHFVSSTHVNVANVLFWNWNFGDGTTSMDIDPVHIYQSTGTFTVSLTITDINGCQNTKTHSVSITTGPVSQFQISNERCTGEPIHFTDISTLSGGQFTWWHWDFGDGHDTLILAPADPDIYHTYDQSGTFLVKLHVYTSAGCEAESQQTIIISPAPVSSFTFENTCANEVVNFTSTSTTNGGTTIGNYYWNFGDPASGINNSSTLQNPTHIYVNPGTYQVTLTVVNASGCSDTITNPVLIHAKPGVNYTWANTCFGSATVFTVDTITTTVGAVASYDWDFGDGTIHSTVQNPTHEYAVAAVYNVTLTIVDTAGCSSLKTYPVTIHPAPTAMFIHSPFGCLNAAVQFTDASFVANGEPITAWHWDFGVNSATNDTSSLQNPGWTYTATGTYNVKLVVYSQYGCTDSIQLPIQVFGNPNANFIYTLPNCGSGAVNFQDSSFSQQSGIVEWLWEFEPNHYSQQANPSYVFYDADSCYPVKLKVTDLKGCWDTITKQVCVPGEFIASFKYTQTCLNNPMYFTDSLISPAGDSLVSFNWNFGDPSSGTQNTSQLRHPSHTYNQPGTYTVIMEAVDILHCTTQSFRFVKVDPLPVPQFTFQSGVCDTIVTFNDISNGNGSSIHSWRWDFGDGTSQTFVAPDDADTTHHYPAPGVYTAVLTIKNSNNCESFISKEVFVSPCIHAAFNTVDSTCRNYIVNFDDHNTTGNISRWRWTFGDGDSLEYSTHQSSVTHAYENPGYYEVQLLVSSDYNGTWLSDSTRRIVYVKQGPSAMFSADRVCYGKPVHFVNQSVGNGTEITKYRWIFGDPTTFADTAVNRQAEYLYPGPGEYHVHLTVSISNGCTDSITDTVSVATLPHAGFSLSSACADQPIVFTNDTTENYTPLSYSIWTFSNDVTGFTDSVRVTNAQYTFHTPGNYIASLYVIDTNGCIDTVSMPFSVHRSPRSEFTFTEMQYFNSDHNLYLAMNNQSAGTAADTLSYRWIFKHDDSNPEYFYLKNPEYVLEQDGFYTLTLITSNQFNCPDTSSKRYLSKGLYIPTAFVPESLNDDLRIFQPKGSGLKTYHIEVLDKWGNRLWLSEQLQNRDGDMGVGDEFNIPGPGWDGKVDGVPVQIGVYVWKVTATFLDGSVWNGQNAGEDQNLSGNVFGTVTVVR